MGKIQYAIFFCFWCFFSSAQESDRYDFGFIRNDGINVTTQNGRFMRFPWTGGLNNPQFSEIDLNLDGIKDLMVFDKSGNRILTFLHNGIGADTGYVFAPEYAERFPLLTDWVLLRDFDCDGYEDIFAYRTGGCSVFRNTSNETGELSFEMHAPILYSDHGTGFPINLYIVSSDIPVIADIDGDGDLDILTFHVLGSYLQLHKNYSVETTGSCDTLYYKLEEHCWGRFMEDENSNVVILDVPCPWGKSAEGNLRHVGSTMAIMDLNGDGNMDLLLGDTDFKNVTALFNSPVNGEAFIFEQDTAFPSYDIPIDMDLMPAVFLLDVNRNGLRDMLVAPNDIRRSASHNGVWYYRNEGTALQPEFRLQETNFLQKDMIDFGEGCYPAVMDFSGNGLTDIIIGNYGYLENTYDSIGFVYANHFSAIAILLNVGSLQQPSFRLLTTDFANLSEKKLKALTPACYDIDADGDVDIIIGCSDGTLIFIENIAGQGNVPVFAPPVFNYMNIDVGNFSAPAVADMNMDGMPDLVIGERSGKLFCFFNTGTPSEAMFNSTPDISNLGGVNVTNPNVTNYGFSTPFLFWHSDTLRLFVGSFSGELYYYAAPNLFLYEDFPVSDSRFLPFSSRHKTAMALADFNSDGFPELIIGNYAGGAEFFEGSEPLGLSTRKPKKEEKCEAFLYHDNIAKKIYLSETCGLDCIRPEISIYDIQGRLLRFTTVSEPVLQTPLMQDGVYLYSIRCYNNVFSGKIIVSQNNY